MYKIVRPFYIEDIHYNEVLYGYYDSLEKAESVLITLDPEYGWMIKEVY